MVDRVPDAVLVDAVAATYLSLGDAARLFRACRRFRDDLAPAWRRLVQARWLAAPGRLHPRERHAVAAGAWRSRAVRVLLYRSTARAWHRHLFTDRRLPRAMRDRLVRAVQRVPSASDVAFDLVAHAACDLWRHRPARPATILPNAPMWRALVALPHARMVHGPWSWVDGRVFRDGRWLAARIDRAGRVWPTRVWRPAAAAWLRRVAAWPADALLRDSTQCPFCGRRFSAVALALPTRPDGCASAACAYAWADWGARWAAWTERWPP